jgi:hypothetical protein
MTARTMRIKMKDASGPSHWIVSLAMTTGRRQAYVKDVRRLPFPSPISSAPLTFGGLSLRTLLGLGDSDPSFDFLRDENDADFLRNDMADDDLELDPRTVTYLGYGELVRRGMDGVSAEFSPGPYPVDYILLEGGRERDGTNARGGEGHCSHHLGRDDGCPNL